MRMQKKFVSIIIPTLNEEGSIEELVKRASFAMESSGVEYEIIFIDDHSIDDTRIIAREMSEQYPVSLFLKESNKGKAQSLLEGFSCAKGDLIAIIDADLQYPPEIIPEMITMLDDKYDIIVANRARQKISFKRKIFSRLFVILFSKLLHNLDCDVQAGLKVFKKEIIKEVMIDPSPWTFDLEFLITARAYGYKIGSIDIPFLERKSGKSKIDFLKAGWEIATNAVKLKFKKMSYHIISPYKKDSMIGAGIAGGKKRFITHTTLSDNLSTRRILLKWQRDFIFFIIILFVAGLYIDKLALAIVFIAALSAIYFIDTIFNLILVLKSLNYSSEIKSSDEDIFALVDEELPIYTILCPLYKEAHMISGFLDAIEKIDWPKEKLDVLLLFEENDKKTISAAEKMALPNYVRVLVVPYSLPQTKPKACNYGLGFAKGEYVVIFDAEDIPDPLQLKKAYLGFKKVPENIGCLQAKLNYFNPHDNLLTKFFAAEYSLWFDVVLPGLQSINTAIPLGGTSNHFRAKDLNKLEGWDPFNVTEDCDLGLRLFKRGFRTAIIDSVTLEEANSNVKNWLRQRSRWIKGYMQTYLVHMRQPIDLFRKNGIHALIFQLIIGGKIAFIFINPVLWLATISYFALYGLVGDAIEMLYPSVVFYMASVSLVFGNFLCVYYYMIGCAKRRHWPIIKYVFFIPAYWFLMSVAATIAAWQIITKPHFWEKTNHGLSKLKNKVEDEMPVIVGDFQKKRNKKSLWENIIPEKRRQIFSSGENIFMISLFMSNLLNFAFNAFMGRILTFEDLGIVTFVNTLLYLAMIFIGAFSSVVNRESAYLAAKEGIKSSSQFLDSVTKKGLSFAIPIAFIWLIMSPLLSEFFNISDQIILISFMLVLIFGIISAANHGFLQGNLFFIYSAAVFLAESLSKLFVAIIFYFTGLTHWMFIAIPASVVIAAILSIKLANAKTIKKLKPKNYVFPIRFFASSILAGISIVVFLSVDIILVKHFLSPRAAGEYALLSLVGKMIYFFGYLPGIFMMTFVSRDIGQKKNPENTFYWIYAATAILTIFAFVALGIFGDKIAPIFFGEKTLEIIPFLLPYAFSISLLTLSNTIVTFQLAKKKYFFSAVSFIIALAMMSGITLFHNGIYDVVKVILWTSVLGWFIIHIMHFQEERISIVSRNIVDLIGAFLSKLPKSPRVKTFGKRILIFNWRDVKHKFAGGAEVYIQEIARHWAMEGNKVTIFCGNDGFLPHSEISKGVEIIRRGGFYFVYVWAFIYYMFRFRGKYDVIIDCQNGIPFFTPLYAKEPVFCLMHHVHQDVFRISLNKPLARLASFLEKDLMLMVYRKVPFITVSSSSRDGIKSVKLGKAGIDVVCPGVDIECMNVGKKSENPMVLYLGRLKAYKSIDVLIGAFKTILQKEPKAVLVIAGSGEEDHNLINLVKKMDFNKEQVVFAGKISDKEKIKLLQKAWVLVNPSMMEGWSIVIIEANACGTPVIASDVSGLRDSVKDSVTGYLVRYGDVDLFAERLLRIIRNKELREKLSANARIWAENFDWNKSGDKFFSIINQKINKQYVREKQTAET